MAFGISESNFNVRSFKRQYLARPARVGMQSEQRKVIAKLQAEPSDHRYNCNHQGRTTFDPLTPEPSHKASIKT